MISEAEYQAFLKDCHSMLIYFKYLHKQFRHAESFNEENLYFYHKAYVELVSSYGDFSGSNIRIYIKSIMDSNKSAEEKYKEYKKYLDEQIELYNKVHIMKKHKQIVK